MRALILGCLVLAGCGTRPPDVHMRCPPLADYTPAQQRAVADDMLRMPEPTAQMITDYGRLRQECRAIQ